MKKIILFASFILAGFAMNAQTDQDPTKKKENKTPNTTQERAINDKGVSVKTRGLSKKTTKNKSVVTEKDQNLETKKKEEPKK